MKLYISLVVLLAAALFGGCSSGDFREGPQQRCNSAGQQAAMDAARAALLNMGFQIDKYDSDAGLIRTKPLTGAQFFELWRGDNAGGYDAAEASLQSIVRTIEMTFRKVDGKVCVLCQAGVKRLSLPERNVAGTAGAYAMFTKSSSQLMTLRLDAKQQQQMAWIDMGLDADLARKVLDAIDKQLAADKGDAR